MGGSTWSFSFRTRSIVISVLFNLFLKVYFLCARQCGDILFQIKEPNRENERVWISNRETKLMYKFLFAAALVLYL